LEGISVHVGVEDGVKVAVAVLLGV
jgi:hypothetical protein